MKIKKLLSKTCPLSVNVNLLLLLFGLSVNKFGAKNGPDTNGSLTIFNLSLFLWSELFVIVIFLLKKWSELFVIVIFFIAKMVRIVC